MQAKGGTRTSKSGKNLAVPVSTIKKTSRGVPSRLRPRNLGSKGMKIKDKLYVRDGKVG